MSRNKTCRPGRNLEILQDKVLRATAGTAIVSALIRKPPNVFVMIGTHIRIHKPLSAPVVENRQREAYQGKRQADKNYRPI